MDISSEKEKSVSADFPTSEEFVTTMGQMVWLLSVSKDHKQLPISWIEAHVSAALMFKQIRIFLKGKQPIAALIWAYASPEVYRLVQQGGYTMKLQDWRSGRDVVVVDCVSPFTDSSVFTAKFLEEVESARADRKVKR